MKSVGLFVLLLFCGARLLALHAGDPAAELKADFVFRGPVPLTGEAAKKNLKTLVFFRTRSAGSRELMNHLADLRERFPKTDFVAVTPDGKGEAKEFFGVYSHNAFAGAADVDFRGATATRGNSSNSAVRPRRKSPNFISSRSNSPARCRSTGRRRSRSGTST